MAASDSSVTPPEASSSAGRGWGRLTATALRMLAWSKLSSITRSAPASSAWRSCSRFSTSTSTASAGALLRAAQPGNGLAGIEDTAVRTGERLHVTLRDGCGGRQQLQKIQCGAFPGQY